MASAHEQWMSAMTRAKLLPDKDKELREGLIAKLSRASLLIDKDDEDHTQEGMREGLQLIRDVNVAITENASDAS